MKSTLLQVVQSILSDMDSENVNTISDTVEAQQVASVVEDTYFNIIAARDIPEHNKLIPLVSLSSTARPTHFTYPSRTKQLMRVDYNIGTSSAPDYREIVYVEPLVFMDRMDETAKKVTTVDQSVELFVGNDKDPSYYTSFNDNHIIMDAYDASVEATLASNKTRAFCAIYPTFSQTDSFAIDLDQTLMPLLLAEAKSACMSLFKGGSDPKVEQSARRLKSYVQNDQYKTRLASRNQYGRT
tara:strand:- start:1080 stop:1802 length:723 start_codon:yes stop_codon:yes gene_type:complete